MPRPRPTPPSTPPAPSPPVHPGDAGAGRPPGIDALYFTVTALQRAAAAVTPCGWWPGPMTREEHTGSARMARPRFIRAMLARAGPREWTRCISP
jgi:hypothetical protein